MFAAPPQPASTANKKPAAAVTATKAGASKTAQKSNVAKPTVAKPAVAKSAAAKPPAVAAKTSTSKSTATRKTTAAKTTAPPVHRYTQQQPTPDRYKEIQQALAERGYFKGQVDGQWGQESVDALKQFQREQKIDEDGKISSLALIALGLGPHRNLPESSSARSTSSSSASLSRPLGPPPDPEPQASVESNSNATPGP